MRLVWRLWSVAKDDYLDPSASYPMNLMKILREGDFPDGEYDIDLHDREEEDAPYLTCVSVIKEGKLLRVR